MNTMTIQELRQLGDKELGVELRKARSFLQKVRIAVQIKQEKALHFIPRAKAYVARILTIQKENISLSQNK